MPDSNPFQGQTAEQYAAGRPYCHPLVIDRVARRLKLDEAVAHAVDVGCGTGLSSIALTSVARRVTAFDVSEGMLAHALPHPRVEYRVAAAENLPLETASCDLMTLASVFHWLDAGAFLAEARRVLRPGAFLVLYDNLFSGEMAGNSAFRDWHREYLERFPSPASARRSPLQRADARESGFGWEADDRFEHQLRFTLEEFQAYLLSQSNSSREPAAVRSCLNRELPDLFEGQDSAEFRFRTFISALRRLD
jgi:ubiquinone/menaquinone biosynthesis C-methylase UbiE